MVPLAGMVTKGGIMKKLGVRIGDLYGTAQFSIEVPEDNLTKESILQAIEDNYDQVRKQLNCIMGGPVVVCQPSQYSDYWGKEIARGNIFWWFLGGHRIDLELKQNV